MEKIAVRIGYKDEYGNPQENSIGEKVEKITEHSAGGEGDKWFYDIHYSDGDVRRVFNPIVVDYKKSESKISF